MCAKAHLLGGVSSCGTGYIIDTQQPFADCCSQGPKLGSYDLIGYIYKWINHSLDDCVTPTPSWKSLHEPGVHFYSGNSLNTVAMVHQLSWDWLSSRPRLLFNRGINWVWENVLRVSWRSYPLVETWVICWSWNFRVICSWTMNFLPQRKQTNNKNS